MHVAGHCAIGVRLDDEINGALLINVANGCVRSDDGFLHFGTLVFRDDGGYSGSALIRAQIARQLTGNGQAALHVLLGKLEGELLSVVVDNLRLLQQQRHEALLAASEGKLGRSSADGWDLLCLCWQFSSSQVQVGTSETGGADTRV